jgi:NAD(P)H dehydrogenase (quinone)
MVTKAKILITGAPGGTQGATAGKIVEMASERGIPIAALVRNHDDRSKRLADLGAEIVIGDLLNLQDVISATSGRDTVFFCYPVRPGLLEASSIMAYAAWEAKLKLVVNLSQGSAARWSPSPSGRKHWLSEHIFSAAKIPTFNLRGGVFYENIFRQFAAGINENSELRAPFADGSSYVPLVAAADISKAALEALLNPQRYAGKTRFVVNELLSLNEVAKATSQCLNRKVVYKEVSIDEWMNEPSQREDVATGNLEQLQHLNMLWQHLLLSNKSGFLPFLRMLLSLQDFFAKSDKVKIDSWLEAKKALFNEI